MTTISTHGLALELDRIRQHLGGGADDRRSLCLGRTPSTMAGVVVGVEGALDRPLEPCRIARTTLDRNASAS